MNGSLFFRTHVYEYPIWQVSIYPINELRHEKTCLYAIYEVANNKGTVQPVHRCSLISAFVVCYLDTVKILNILTPQKFAVITLKFEQDGFTKKLCIQKMQPELQTV